MDNRTHTSFRCLEQRPKGPHMPDKLRYFMDETSAPYPEGENPFVRTKEDDEFDDTVIKEFHLNE